MRSARHFHTLPSPGGGADPEATYNSCLSLKLCYKNRVINMTPT